MYKYNCKFCGDVEIKSNRHAGAHVRNCNKNPNKGKSIERFVLFGVKAMKEKQNKLKILYYESPKKCLNCDCVIPYEKRDNKYCCHSCSASSINKTRTTKKYTLSETGLENLKKNGKIIIKKLNEFYVKNPDKYNNKIMSVKKRLTKPKIEFECPVCNKKLLLSKSEHNRRKYCSGRCRNIKNNREIYGVRSKSETMLEERLKKEFPNLEIIFNDRKTLNGKELDVYIPKLMMGIEWNGIYHYKKIREDNSFEKTQKKDKEKIKECKRKNIKLHVVKDMTSNVKFINSEIEKIITLLREMAG